MKEERTVAFRSILLGLILGWIMVTPGLTQDRLNALVDTLRAQGYARITVERTWLGRYRIEAKGRNGEREIVLNERTGEVLRDYVEFDDDDDDHDGDASGRGSASVGRADGDDDDAGDDNSGHGSSNSGHGGDDGDDGEDGDHGGDDGGDDGGDSGDDD